VFASFGCCYCTFVFHLKITSKTSSKFLFLFCFWWHALYVMWLLWSSRDNDVVFIGTSKGPVPGRPGGSNTSRSRRRQSNIDAVFVFVLCLTWLVDVKEEMKSFGFFRCAVRIWNRWTWKTGAGVYVKNVKQCVWGMCMFVLACVVTLY